MNPQDANRLASSAIFILGAPRSGTTWLAKIIDSHPDILYRHEPDEVSPPDSTLSPHAQTMKWVGESRVRVATKAPYFKKTWHGRFAPVHAPTARALNGIDKYAGSKWCPRMPMLGAEHAKRAAIKVVGWDGSAVCATMPHTRTLFILRHPCAQVASSLNGLKGNRFKSKLTENGYRQAIKHADRAGIDVARFEKTSLATQLAWFWLGFNEDVIEQLRWLPNSLIVSYDELCANPTTTARSLFDFVELSWHSQTEKFLADSTETEGADYYGVMRQSTVAADAWRSRMSEEDQHDVQAVIQHSNLAKFWTVAAPPSIERIETAA